MLNEIANTRQVPGEGRRRWFTDNDFDLIIWYEQDGSAIAGFQLCYDKEGDERALTWRRGEGFAHQRIDDGELAGRVKMTPVLVPDGIFNFAAVAEQFLGSSGKINADIREFVYKRVMLYPRSDP